MTTHPNTEQSKKLERYDIPGHAHELTFPCYHRFHYLNDAICCALFIDELSQAREHFLFVTADLARPEACPQLDWGARATQKKACRLHQSIDMGTRAQIIFGDF
jgi:hypothetical protein